MIITVTRSIQAANGFHATEAAQVVLDEHASIELDEVSETAVRLSIIANQLFKSLPQLQPVKPVVGPKKSHFPN